jgi:hypothetical protein
LLRSSPTSTSPSLLPTPTTHHHHQCFELERLINGELRELRAAAERAQASTTSWAASLAPLDDALRSLGDSESFFSAAAREVEGVAAALSALSKSVVAVTTREAANTSSKEGQQQEGPSER